jgi:D-threo-aldose 1-dehydrogenase
VTDLALGRIGLGTAPLGNLYAEVTEEDARATVDAAWDAGIRLFDTAPLYGHGLAERRLGAALAAHPRDELVISTKVGRLLRPGVPEPEGVPGLAGDVPQFDFSADGVRCSRRA